MVGARNWVFRHEITERTSPPPKPDEKPLPTGMYISQHASSHLLNLYTGTYTRDVTQTEVSLFRFSALTFNAHKIHYSRDWCQNVEGHRDLVVHGPLNLINILDLYRDTNERSSPEAVPKSISYRAMSPLYVGEKYRIVLEKDSDTKDRERPRWKAEIGDSYGKTGMKATITE